MSEATIVTVKATVMTPAVPDSFRISGTNQEIPVSAIEREDLRHIADAWYDELLKVWEAQTNHADNQ